MTDEAQAKRDLVAESFGNSAEIYHLSPFFHHCARRLVELAELEPDTDLLDVATGRGAVLFPAAQQLSEEGMIRGIDLAEEMVGLTNEEIGTRGLPNASALVMDAESLDFDDATFDRVTCGFGLMFMPDLDRALAEMYRVLRPGGRIAVSTWGPPNELTRTYVEMVNDFSEEAGPMGKIISHPLQSTEALHGALDSGGFEMVHAIDEAVTVTFADEEEWLQQQMAISQRRFDRLTTDAQGQVKVKMGNTLASAMTVDGIPETRTVFYGIGVKPS